MATLMCRNCMFNINQIKYIRYLSDFSRNVDKLIDIMPKDNSKLVNKLRETRIKNAHKTEQLNKYPSNVVQLNIVGNGSPGNPRAVFVTTDRTSYLFNCGEGTQRLCHEYSFKLAKLEHILFTRRCAENLGGVVGLTLTCQDIGVPSLTFHGPPNIDKFLNMYKPFIAYVGMQIHSHSYLDKTFEDIEMEIKCLPIFKSFSLANKQSNCDQLLSDDIAFVYVCKLQTLSGQLLVDKCIELRVPPGPMLGVLKSGKDVVLPDNRTIYSKDVVGPEEKGPIFLVLECPSIDHIDSLVNNEQLQNYRLASNEFAKMVSVLVHFSPPEVISDERYKNWMSAFNEDVTHIICNSDCNVQNFQAVYRFQSQLNLIDSSVFPQLYTTADDTSHLGKNVIKAPSLLKYHLRPSVKKGLDNEDVVIIDNQQKISETLSNKIFSESLEKYRTLSFTCNNFQIEYPEIIFLGTGSAVPSKVRNTSAIWVNINSDTSLLLDCGEGTCGQVFRFFGNNFESRLKSLNAIYISHLHADHHLGLLQIIKSRSLITKYPIILLIPPHIKNWLENYNNRVEDISQFYQIYLNEIFCHQTCYPDILEKLNLVELKTTFVKHCSHSYGISFKTANSMQKIVYSGDAMPTKSLIDIGKNCDLLIHEATMEDDLADEAKIKCHSTTSEAINMGIKMNAKFTILTHFSQRYSKVPIFNEMFNETVGIAFDNMRINVSDLKKLPFMISTIKCLFSEQIEEMEAKTAIKKKRKELISKYLENINT